jgi:hypothetical protein
MRLGAKQHHRFRPSLEGLEDRRVPAILINELSINLPGGTDTPWEYVELRGTPSVNLTDTYFVQFEGNISITDSTQRGKADFVQSLTGLAPGSSGLLVIKATAGGHTIPAGTTVVGNALFDTGSGALENGAATYMLIKSTTPIVPSLDYDGDDNGVLELPAGAVVLDSVGWFEDYTDEFVYTNVILDQSAGTPDAACRFNNMNLSVVAAWYNGDLTGTSSTVDFDPAELSPNFPTGGVLTPGAANSHPIPNAPPSVASTSRPTFAMPPAPMPNNPTSPSAHASDVTFAEASEVVPGTPIRTAHNTITVGDVVLGNLFDTGL